MSVDPTKLFFQAIESHQDWYLESYNPPNPGYPFAILYMTIITNADPERIATEMEARCLYWYERFEIPVLTLASLQSDKPTRLNEVRNYDTLAGFSKPRGSEFHFYWRSVRNDEWPAPYYSNGELLSIYHDVPNKNSIQTRRDALAKLKPVQFVKLFILVATVLVPMAWLVYDEFFSPRWMAWTLFGYGFIKLTNELLVLTGKLKRSKLQIEKEKRELQEKHWIYHCEQNPEGFERLKMENFKKSISNSDAEYERSLKKQVETGDV